MRLYYRKRFLLPLVLTGLFLTACGAPAISPEPDHVPVEVPVISEEELVEAPVTPTEAPVEAFVPVEEPAVVEEAPALEPAADYVVYPGAEFVNSNNWGSQIRVHRYITDEPLDEVMAFYQLQYPYLKFYVSGGSAAGLVAEEDEEHLETGVFNVWIYRTDEAYFDQMAFMPSSYIPGDVLEAMPNSMTLIEIHTTN